MTEVNKFSICFSVKSEREIKRERETERQKFHSLGGDFFKSSKKISHSNIFIFCVHITAKMNVNFHYLTNQLQTHISLQLQHYLRHKITIIMNQQCKVCGEPAAGFHFGAFTCEGCKVSISLMIWPDMAFSFNVFLIFCS
jgi:Zinc finger, C4 type (two domains)